MGISCRLSTTDAESVGCNWKSLELQTTFQDQKKATLCPLTDSSNQYWSTMPIRIPLNRKTLPFCCNNHKEPESHEVQHLRCGFKKSVLKSFFSEHSHLNVSFRYNSLTDFTISFFLQHKCTILFKVGLIIFQFGYVRFLWVCMR